MSTTRYAIPAHDCTLKEFVSWSSLVTRLLVEYCYSRRTSPESSEYQTNTWASLTSILVHAKLQGSRREYKCNRGRKPVFDVKFHISIPVGWHAESFLIYQNALPESLVYCRWKHCVFCLHPWCTQRCIQSLSTVKYGPLLDHTDLAWASFYSNLPLWSPFKSWLSSYLRWSLCCYQELHLAQVCNLESLKTPCLVHQIFSEMLRRSKKLLDVMSCEVLASFLECMESMFIEFLAELQGLCLVHQWIDFVSS